MRAKASSSFVFEENTDYQNVYFLKIDAAGHSSIVAQNTADVVNRFFEAFEDSVRAEIDEAKKLNGCMYSRFWGWAGDGGLCVIYDREEESRALKTSVEAACNILMRRVGPLRHSLRKLNANGIFSVRVAVHKGVIRYTDFDRQGSIHSKDLNFVAHLEVATPHDCLTISKDIFDQCPPDIKSTFFPLPFEFEGRKIFALSERPARDVAMDWMTKVSVDGSKAVNLLSRRYGENDKAQIISAADSEIVDLGTALNTCSHYLIAGKRPQYYRDAVVAALRRNVRYVCLALDPDSDVAKDYAEHRGEADLLKKIKTSVGNLAEFAKSVPGLPFEVWLYSSLPHLASILVDRKKEGIIVYAPYLPTHQSASVARADSPHMLLRISTIEPLAAHLNNYVDFLMNHPTTKRAI
jgi:hypothetical protein